MMTIPATRASQKAAHQPLKTIIRRYTTGHLLQKLFLSSSHFLGLSLTRRVKKHLQVRFIEGKLCKVEKHPLLNELF